MTRDEFEDHIKGFGVLLGLCYANESILGDDTLANAYKHKEAALAAFDEMAARIAELEAACDSAMDALANGDLVGVHRHLLPVWSRERE